MITYFLLIVIERVLCVLPREAARAAGRFLGNLWYFVDARHRHVAKRNLAIAFEREKTYAQICRLARDSFRHMGVVFTDSLRLPEFTRSSDADAIVIEGAELVEQAFQKGNGLLFCIPHFGNWEMLVLLGNRFSRPLYDVAREVEDPHIARHVRRTRKISGMRFIDKENSARRILASLRDNSGVGIFMDQNAGREGIYIDFFGRKASTYPTVAALAPRTGASVLIIYCFLDENGRYHIRIENPPAFVMTGDPGSDVVENTAAIAGRFEEIIRERPAQYFWVHQRWKPIQNELMRREFRRVESIIIKLPNWIGDIVMSIPAMKYVREVFPEARLRVLVKQQLAGLVADDPDIDGVITYRMRRGPARLIDEFRIIRHVRREYANLAVIFPYSISSALWMFLAGIPFRLGSAVRRRGFILTHVVSPKAKEEHQREYFLRMVRRLGTQDLSPAPRISIGSAARENAEVLLRRLKVTGAPAVVGIHPGAAYGPAKRWFPARFAELAGRLSSEGIRVLIFGTSSDGPVVDEIIAEAGDSVTNLCGQLSLGEFAALLAKCDVVVANDSGPMHLAGAVGAKVVAIFGSTSPRATSPSGQCRIIRKDIDCSPCFRRDCPHQYRCLELISVDEVYSAVRNSLGHGDHA